VRGAINLVALFIAVLVQESASVTAARAPLPIRNLGGAGGPNHLSRVRVMSGRVVYALAAGTVSARSSRSTAKARISRPARRRVTIPESAVEA
jgi:hypothetical protein